jgi:hypothetical protein
MVSPFLPYPGVPHAGGKLVCFLLQTLVRNHSVYLVSRYYPGEENHIGELRKMLSGLELVSAPGPVNAGSILSVGRTVRSYFRLARKAREVLNRETFDVCQVEFTETGVFWGAPRYIPAILTCVDIIAKPAFRRYEASRGISKVLQWCIWKTKKMMEKRALAKFARVFTLSDEDREWGERLYPGVSFRVLRYPGGLGFTGLPRKEVSGRILFLGALNRPQNVDAVRYFWEKVWPAVRERVPDTEFRVAGGGLPKDLEREMSEDPRVVLTGFVENIEQEYNSASVFVAPILTGGGVIVKILDALAAGVPVVTTTYGNEGIRAEPGKEVFVADNPGDFASFVVHLLRDEELRNSVGSAGRQYVENNFSKDSLAATVEEAYKEISRNPSI